MFGSRSFRLLFAGQAISVISPWDHLGSVALLPLGQGLAGPVGGAIGLSSTLYGAAGLILVLTMAVLAVPAVRDFAGICTDLQSSS